MPSLIISRGKKVIAELKPNAIEKKYDIEIKYVKSDEEVKNAKVGTLQDGDIVHSPDGNTIHRVSLNSIRGDYKDAKENKNRLRMWEKADFISRPDDIFQEQLYCVQWMKMKPKGSQFFYDFRTVTADDLKREQTVIDFVSANLADWQEKGFVPDMVIESGSKTDEPIRTRGWTHWHHSFNPRQLLLNGLIRKYSTSPASIVAFCQAINRSSRLCVWDPSPGLVLMLLVMFFTTKP